MRPLYDDGDVSASTVTRDYVFDLDAPGGSPPLLSVFGGKLTTYRKLAEHALAELREPLRFDAREWTRGSILPGGDFQRGDFEQFARQQAARYGFIPAEHDPQAVPRLRNPNRECVGTGPNSGSAGREIAPQLYEAS